jgi:F-type H+-transporting ATPase subunit b
MQAFGLDPIKIIWHLVNFAILLFVLAKFVFPRVVTMLDERERRIRESMARAEETERARADLEMERMRILDEARREAAAINERVRQTVGQYEEQLRRDAEAAATQIRARAEADAEATRLQAVSEVRQQVADLAIQAAERVIRESMDGARQRTLVEQFLATAEPGSGAR